MLVGFGKYSLSQLSKDLLARSSRAVRWGNVAKPTNIFKWNVTSFLMTFMYLCVRWFMMQHYKSRAMYSHCLPMKTVSGPWKRQCDVTLPTPRTSFSFTPQFGISLFSCFSSPPYSPVALCVFNRIFSPKKKIFSPYLPKYCFRCHAAGQPSFSLKLTCLFFHSFKTLLRLRELKGWLSFFKLRTTL